MSTRQTRQTAGARLAGGGAGGGAVAAVRSSMVLRQSRGRRRRRWILRTVAMLALLAALAAGYMLWLRDSSLVAIKHLEIRGISGRTDEGRRIQKAVVAATGEMTTLHLRPQVLTRSLSGFPRVAGVKIDADFPNGATVTVIERRDGSILGEGESARLVASDGTILGPAGAAAAKLPRLGVPNPPKGERLSGPALEQAVALGAVPDALRQYVVGSTFGSMGLVIRLTDGTQLRFGDASHARLKWRAAASVLADSELGDFDYVDLSVPHRPAVGGGETSSATETGIDASSY